MLFPLLPISHSGKFRAQVQVRPGCHAEVYGLLVKLLACGDGVVAYQAALTLRLMHLTVTDRLTRPGLTRLTGRTG